MKKCLFLLLFSLLALTKIKCESVCSSCTKVSTNKKCNCGDNPTDCRWMKINAEEDLCIECPGIKDGESQYYSRKYSTDNKPFCHIVGKSGYSGAKMIYETKQIVSNCKEYGLFNLGDFCFDSCPENSKDNSDKMCNCENLFYKEIVEGLTYYNCIKDGDPCPEGYFYRNDKECVKACPKGKPYLEKVEDTKDYLCKAQCPFNLKKYSEAAPIGDKINTYCLQKCPDNAKYYYDDDNVCLEKCSKNNNDFYNKDDKCVYSNNVKSSDCGNYYYIKVSKEENIFQCVQSETQNPTCPQDYPYKYSVDRKTYCLSTCDDTNIPFFGNLETILYKNECKDKNILNSKNLYLVEKEKRYVDDCSEEIYFPFHDGKKCVPNCGGKYIDNDTSECLENCDGKFTDEETKTCFENCPDYLGRGFYNENSKKCVSCEMNNEENAFHLLNDNKCYSKCPENYKHNFNSNICYEGECSEHDYKFSYNGNDDTCYYTCKDIGNEYTVEKDYKCYKESDIGNDNSFNNYYFYKTSYQYKKYIHKDVALKECFQNGLKYLKENQCVENCNDDNNEYQYKVIPTNNNFGICFKTLNDCQKDNIYIFYNYSKICSQQCDYYIIDDVTGNIKEFENNNGEKGNCFLECPQDYPYLDNKICRHQCDDCYIEEDGIKKCVSKNNYFIKEIGENKIKQCVQYCTKSEEKDNNGVPIFGYYDSNKICLDTCIGNEGYEFSYEATNTHQECLPSCPNNEYYDQNTKICLKKCDNFIQNKGSRICVDYCPENEYVLPGNICNNQCENDAPFYITTSIQIEEGQNYNIKKCVQSCQIESGYKYFNPNTKECLEEPADSTTIKIYHGGLYENCPEGLELDSESKICKIVPTSSEDCQKYKTTSLECLDDCPIGEHFIENNDGSKNCLSNCPGNGFYVKVKAMDTYIIYKCVTSCSDENNYVHLENSKECIPESKCKNLYVDNGVCYSSCQNENTYLFFDSSNDKYICSGNCNGEYPFLNEQDKMCVKDCSFMSSKIAEIIGDNKKCVNLCQTDGYKFLEIRDDNKLYCSNDCERYIKDINVMICVSKCQKPNNFVNGNECLDKCPIEDGKDYIFFEKDGEYICSETIDQNYPYSYENEKLYLRKCNPGDYVEQESKICTNNCPSLNNDVEGKYYFYYESDEIIKENTCVLDCSSTQKPFTRKNKHCDIECDSNPLGDYYYSEGTKNCIKKDECNGKIDGRICRNSCNDLNKYYNENNDLEKFCLSNCYYSTQGYIYYKENDFKCQNSYSNFQLQNNMIILDCSQNNNNYFYYEDLCINECPKGYNFLLNDNKCLDDCPQNNEYYTKDTLLSKKILKCDSNCDAYTLLDENKRAKLCLEGCKYPYQYVIDDNSKECLEKCPSDKQYYYSLPNNNYVFKCVNSNEIPTGYIQYKDTNKYIKESECFPNYVNYISKKCVTKCSDEFIYIKDIDDQTKINYCSDNCNNFPDDGLHLNLNGKQCIKSTSCSSDNEELKGEQCDCANLFYIDISSGIKVCIDYRENNCSKQIEYPYLIYGTKECNNTCDGIISLTGSICHKKEENYNCPEYSTKILSNGLQQCKCDGKYYYYDTENSKEIKCLSEDSKCPKDNTINRELFISETKECVEYCPFGKYSLKFGKTCVDSCPTNSKIVNDECLCEDKWYINEEEKMICVTECPEKKPILIDETKECVETCKNTEYPVYFRNKCYLDCQQFQGTVKIEKIQEIEQISDSSHNNYKYKEYHLNEKYGQFGENICYCEKAWYEDENNYECDYSEGSIDIDNNPCKVFDNKYSYKYIVLPTNQCVEKCPEIFKYSFNEYCFESCEDKGLEKNGDSNICICPNLWRYSTNDLSKIECIEEENCENNELLIVATKECYYSSQCKEEYPLLFNKKCYNKANCPENTLYKEDSPKACSCVNYYYIDSNNDIICLPENYDCPSNYPNLIFSINKCVKDGDSELNELYNFNRVYYSNCPLYTKYDSDKDLCVCDFIYGFWYEESNHLECGLLECPEELPQYLGNTRQCIKKCSSEEKKYVEYNGICYEECPELTKENENGICELEPTNDSNNVTEITKIIENNIVDLYTASTQKEKEDEDEGEISSIIELTNSNLTVEFYGVNKNKKDKKEKHNNKDKISSSLSFIDLSECIEKIYETNNMDPDDDIIILKYDLKDTPKEYLINPVEYKFISSRNGKELDASACGHGAIKISYPFFNIISNYDKLTHKKRNLKSIMIDLKNENDLTTLSEKYNLGKEINDQYSSIDTFNSKDNIYTDFCTAVEINGKDLILEDRMNYLLPHYSLCEKNCSYNHTDFEEERIYCDCSFKNEFDLNREHEAEIELNENAVIQSQNGKTNFPVLKCISVLGDSKRIKKNIGFYYMLVVVVIEIYLLIMTLIFGIKAFVQFFGSKIHDSDITENDAIEINEKDKDNKKYEDEIIKTTQRALNAPPIKNNNNGENTGDNNNEKNEIEFIPEEFLFLYFNEKDKGVRKQIEKNELPFNISPNTKVLLQKMENVDYSIVKASGPFHEEQNLIEVIGNNEEPVNINIESINETINDNNISEKNQNQNKLNENGLITISEEKIYKKENLKDFIINENDEIVENKNKEINTNKTFLNELKIEQRLLTKDYNFVVDKNESGLLSLILTEIFDKIYIIKNILFIRKFEIMYLYLSVYVLYHVILLTIIAMFYDINTIKNIWNKENYPGIGLHLGYGIISILISWIIYIVIMCLLTNRGKYNEIMNIKNSKKRKKENKTQLINKKCNSLISKMKTKMIVYYIIQFILIVAFFIYLVTLCAVYSGTMTKIFSSYGIAILELIIIKIIYGLILAILRHSSLSNKKENLYNIVLFFDKYLV